IGRWLRAVRNADGQASVRGRGCQLKSDKATTVIHGGLDAHYLPTGHIVYTTGSALYAVPFNLQRRVTTGAAVPLVEDVRRPALAGGAEGVVTQPFPRQEH